MKKIQVFLIMNIIIAIAFMLIAKHSVYADLIVDERFNWNKDENKSNYNSTYSHNTSTNNTEIFDVPNKEKNNIKYLGYIIAGSIVIIVVGASIIILNKTKKENKE